MAPDMPLTVPTNQLAGLPLAALVPRRATCRAILSPGLTLAAIAIPEQMATARLGGFAPQIGFFAFIAGSIGFAMLGGNRFLSCGADSTITPIFAGGLALVAADRLAGVSGARGGAGADGRRRS